jgi:hypothetical protein
MKDLKPKKTKEEKKKWAEDVYWKIENEGRLYWAANYCAPKNAPTATLENKMNKIKDMSRKLESLIESLIENLGKYSDEID